MTRYQLSLISYIYQALIVCSYVYNLLFMLYYIIFRWPTHKETLREQHIFMFTVDAIYRSVDKKLHQFISSS